MKKKDPEDLLWSLSSQAPVGRESADLSDEDLQKYRSGALDPESEKNIESALAADRDARKRLAALAGVQLPAPPPSLRRRILSHRPGGELAAKRRAPGWGRGGWWLGAVAAGILALVSLPLLRPPTLPQDLQFDLQVQGLAARRGEIASGSPTPRIAEALPDTRIQLRIEPQGEASSEIRFSLFRRIGDHLERLSLEPPLSLEVRRGAALIEGPARALAGTAPGVFDFFVVAHRPKDEPPELVDVRHGDPAASLADGERRRVIPWQIRLRAQDHDEDFLEENL